MAASGHVFTGWKSTEFIKKSVAILDENVGSRIDLEKPLLSEFDQSFMSIGSECIAV